MKLKQVDALTLTVAILLVIKGGIIVLAAIEGNGSRPSHKGTGINDGTVMYTLNSTEVHGVVCSNGKKS